MPKFTLPLKIAGGAVFLLSFFAFRAISATISEGFESGQKGAYAAADINLSTGTWNLNDALIGNLSSDVKNGSQSVRIRNSGKVTMKFDRTTGAGTVTIKHAKYGNDASTTWGLWCSTNSGSSWTPVGSIVTTSSQSLQTATFTPNISGLVRCEVRKTDGTSNRTNIDDFVITDYGSSSSPSLPAGSVPFFDNINNPVSGLAYGSPADVTPTVPTLNNFDRAVTDLCGQPGTAVSPSNFQAMMNSNSTVLANIKQYVGGYLIPGRTSNADFLVDLTNVWFNVDGFDHIFCGEPVAGGSIGGLHFVGRYVELQEKGLAGRLNNNISMEEVVPNTIYTMGVVMKVGNSTSQSPIKGYGYTLSAEEILAIATLAYKNNPNTSSTNTACHWSVTDDGRTFKAVFVRRSGGVRTFYPDATPGSNPNCVQ
ncbi:EndoU domain-containing protein [Nostocaceae cyanobacterium CENA357]|uniref:EndoU domain-containing protein n=1 Tax=Atlanticothrix silvestris CENA357 TaxID=1725252 RepID=A0A8J7H9X6_9CYAN|nr:EndoU domain-containing protein [Atlanticothrix silvestris]MBH8552252.1 EndoU domain-containing protein [Atlanticothrix silvestris CENA357]